MHRKVGLEYFFEQVGESGCGVCAVNTIAKMYEKRGLIFPFSRKKGSSPFRILHELRKLGFDAVSKTVTANYLINCLKNLKSPVIVYYPPPVDHYIVVAEIASDGWLLVYDSARKEPYWISPFRFRKRWCETSNRGMCGWLIRVKLREGN